MSMNPAYVYPKEGNKYEVGDDIMTDWHAGTEFRLYKFDGYISNSFTLRLRMASFTHIIFVWQNRMNEVKSHTMELK